MQHLAQLFSDLFKHSDSLQKSGFLASVTIGTIGLTDIEQWLRVAFLIISICLGILTIVYTQEKRRVLKDDEPIGD